MSNSQLKYLFVSFFILFFGVISQGFSQVTRGCLPECRPQGQGNITATDFILEDQAGNIIDVDNCDNIQGPIFVSFEYRSNNLNNVFFVSNLLITSNLDNSIVGNVEFDYLIGNLAGTQGNNTQRHRFEVTLPATYDCQSHNLQLTDIEIRWTQPNRAATCNNYNGGSCRHNFGNRDVSVGGFFYSFDYEIGCFEEDGSVAVNFVLRNLAGGQRPYAIEWTIDKNGETDIIQNRNIVAVRLQNTSDIVSADLLVTHSGGQTMNPRPGPITPAIPEIFTVSGVSFTNNDQNLSTFPNGSISIDMGSLDLSNFEFIWTDDFDNFIEPPDPMNPTFLENLEEGMYNLVIRDLETGLCRVFEFPLDFIILPVLFDDLSLGYNDFDRSIMLNWSTKKEWETSHFEIERALQSSEFQKLGDVKAAGWSDKVVEYFFVDESLPLAGGNILYRLRQVSLNGNFEYSKVLSIRVPGMESTHGVWRVFPNPTNGDRFNFELVDARQYSGEEIRVVLISPSANPMILSGRSIKDLSSQIHEKIENAPRGVYLLQVSWGNKNEQIRVLKH